MSSRSPPPRSPTSTRSVLQAYATNPAREASKIEAAQRDLGAASGLDPQNARVKRIQAAAAEAAR
jgi:hypothetical protein